MKIIGGNSASLIRRCLFSGCLAIIVTLTFSEPAFAYLDPGTGSMILQVLLGGIAGAMVVGRLYWQRIKEIVGIKPKVADESSLERNNEKQG